MKARIHLFLSLFLALPLSLFAQSAGDFRTVTSGDWNSAATWQSFDGTAWIAASSFPSSADGAISIEGGHVITIPSAAAITADQLTVQENAQLLVASGASLVLVNGAGTDLTIAQAVTGTVPGVVGVSGTLKANNDVSISSLANSLAIRDGGTYQHHYTTSSGDIPLANWEAGSSLLISGYTSNELAPGNLGQGFHHVVWNTPDLSNTQGFINLGGALKTVNGSLTVRSTGTAYLNFSETTETLVVKEAFTLDNSRKVYVNAPIEIKKNLQLLNSTLENASGLTLADGATFLFEGNSFLKGISPGATGSYHLFYKNLSASFTPGPELPQNETALASLTVESGNLRLPGQLTVNGELSLAIGGALSLNGNDLFLKGSFINNGTFEAGSNKVQFNGTSSQSIEGANTTTFHTLELINTATPGLVARQHTNISHSLVLGENVTLDPDGSDLATDGGINFTLLSNAYPHAASIAPLPATAQVTGNVVIQRFIPAPPVKEYKYITTSTKNVTLGQWTDDFTVTGPHEGGDGGRSSIYIYDEYQAATTGNGYVEFPGSGGSLSSPVEIGKGYTAMMFNTSTPTLIDTRGPVQTGDFTYPISFTAEGTSSFKGFNLIGNPYPSAIDWSSPAWQRKDISPTATIFIKDGGKDSRITWNAITGIGLNSANNSIPGGQAFFVKALSSTASLVATENVKVTTPATDIKKTIKDVVVVTFSNSSFKDQAAIAFREGATAGYDPLLDSEKQKNATINLYSTSSDGTNLSQSLLPWFNCSLDFPLVIDQAAAGAYQLSFSYLNTLSKGVTILLQDNFLNTSTTVSSETVYNFDITSDPLSYGSSRFSLLFSYSAIPEISSLTYEESCTGTVPVAVNGTTSGINYQLFKGATAVTDVIAATSDVTSFSINAGSLAEGANTITVQAFRTGCDPVTMATELQLDYSGNYTISSTEGATSCTATSVTLYATASSDRATYKWYESLEATTALQEATTASFTTPVLEQTTTYYVAAVNAYGCESERVAVEAIILQVSEISSLTYEESCTGTVPVTANGTVAGVNYQLFKGSTAVSEVLTATSTTTSFSVNTADLTEGSNTISVQAHYSGCTPASMATELQLDYSGKYTISSTEGATSCTAASVTLNATASSDRATYKWYESLQATIPVHEAATGAFTTLVLEQSTTYYVAAVNLFGCESNRVAVEAVIQNLTQPTITVENEVLISSYETGNQWLLNGAPIANATNATFLPSESGTYGLEVIFNGCTLVAESITFTVTGIEDIEVKKSPLFSPNPAQANIFFNKSLFENKQEVSYNIYQTNGTILQKGTVKESDNTIDLGHLKNGLYLLKVVKGDTTYFEKLIKN
jgi:hypothetical protein